MSDNIDQPSHDPTDSHEGDEPRRKSRKSRVIIIAFAVVIVLVLIATIRFATDFSNDVNDEIGAKIHTSEATETMQEGGDPNEQLDKKRDGDKNKKSKEHEEPKKKDYTNRDAGTLINDMTFPTTKSREGTNIFRSTDRLTSDNAAIDSIIDLVNVAYQSSADMAGGGDPLSLDGYDTGDDAGHIAYMFFGGEQKVVAAMHEGAKHGWVLPNDKVFVFDHDNPGVYKVAFQLSLPNGEPAYFVTGYYDPVVDSIQVASANLTEAGDRDLLER